MLYLPTAGLGYAAFGFQVRSNIIENLSPNVIITIIEMCFLVHCFTVVLIVINPVFLDLEELIRIPNSACAVQVNPYTIIDSAS